MIKKSVDFAWILFVFFFIFLSCKTGVSQTSGEITFLDKNVPNNDLNQDSCFAEYCEQRIRYFNFNPAFYLVQKYSDSPYILEDCFQCSLFKLVIGNDTVDLDSVYRKHSNSEQVRYMAGFTEGSYLISNGVININLTFINLRTNTSTDTSHKYSIVYNSKNKKLISVDMRFLNE